METWKSDIPLGKFCPSIGLMLKERLQKRPEHIILKEKVGNEFHSFRWYELYHEISLVGTSLLHLGLKKGDRVGVISRNGKGMLVLELAVMSIGGISVPVFSEYPFPQLEHTLGNAMPKYVVVDSLPHLEEFAKTEISKKVERIFLMEEASTVPRGMRRNVYSFQELINMHRDTSLFEKTVRKNLADDPCLIQYTSGTTGLPKGVVLTHRNILSQRKAQEHLWNLTPSDRFLSYLPWHHSFGGIFERFTALYFSCCLALDDSCGKDLSLLIRNFIAIKPTVYFSVPKIYQSLVNECINSRKLEKEIFHAGIKFFFTAAAPLPKDVEQYITSKNIPIVEGWGLTETSPCVTLTLLDEERCAHVVGKPIPGVKMKINKDGEILVKGPNVMKEYFRMPEKTKDVFTRDGWFKTGDLGERSPKGLLLKGRKDGIFKLSNGEKIFSQILETQLVGNSDFIEQAILAGSGYDFVSAFIFPDFRELAKYLKKNRVEETDRIKIIRNNLVRELYLKELKRINEDIYPHYSRIGAFVLIPDELSLFRGELTPSLKVVKPKVLQNYAPLIESIYHPEKSEKRFLEEIIKIEGIKEIEGEMRLI
jgi:long-subunit acyl-CoA synthetase (AMP-forming)